MIKNYLLKTSSFIVVLVMLFCNNALATDYYVATSGSDSNSGTSTGSPFKTIQKAISEVSAGDYIYLRGGTHVMTESPIVIQKNGASGSNIHVYAYGSETPVLRFDDDENSSKRGIVQDGDYWHWKGVTIERAGDNGMLLSGNNNTIDNCIFRKNNDTGLQLSRFNTSASSIGQWPSNNLIVGCESFDNADSDSEDADGFAAKLTSGTGNIFRGCVAHHNIDDGWDLYTKSDTGPIGKVLFEDCIAHNNGVLTDGNTSGGGDKNGFKLGSSAHNIDHELRRCIAYGNGKHGFTDNGNVGNIKFYNLTSYDNAEYNFHTRDNASHTFRNCISFDGGNTDRIRGNSPTSCNALTETDIDWTLTASSSDFQTMSQGPDRNPTSNGFLNLKSGSGLINQGCSASGVSGSGSLDLGAIEYGSTMSGPGEGGSDPDPDPNPDPDPTPDPDPVPTGDQEHNFTASGSSSSFFNITGNLSSSKGTVSYGGLTLTQCLKMESSTSISFTSASEGSLTLVFNDDYNGGVNIDGTSKSVSSGILTTTISSGSHTITKDQTSNLYFISLEYDGGTTPTPNQYTVSTSTNGSGSVSGGGTYAAGTTIFLTASPNSGYTFNGWTGSASGSSNPLSVTVDSNKSISASFSATSSGDCEIVVYQMEDGTISNGSVDSNNAGYNGSGFANTDNSAGEYVEIAINVPSARMHDLSLRYAATSDRPANVSVNGSSQLSSLNLPSSGAWASWATVDFALNLQAGNNTIRFTANGSSGLPNLDEMTVCQGGGTVIELPTVSLNASGADGFVSLNWSVSNGSIYNQQVYRDTDSDPSGRVRIAQSITGTSFTDNTVTNGTTYYYWIKASASVDGSNVGSNAAGATPEGNQVQLPSISLSTSASDTQVSLNWSVSNGTVSSQEVYRDTDSDPSGRVRMAYVNGTSYTDNTAVNGTSYYYWIKAVAAVDGSTVNSNASNATPQGTTDPDPVESIVHNFTESGTSSSFFNITGNLSTSKGTVNYNGLTLTQCLKIESSTSISFASSESAELVLVFNNDFNDGFKVDGTSYNASFGILSLTLSAGSHTLTKDNSSNLYYISLVGDQGGVTPPGDDASISLSASAGDNQVSLNWSVSNGSVSNVNIKRNGSTISSNVSGTSYTDNSVSNGTTYSYAIEATSNGNTVVSNSVSATPFNVVIPPIGNGPIGYASLAGGTTGGQGGVSYNCSTGDCISDLIKQKLDGDISSPLTIYITGTITPSNTNADNKVNIKDVRDVSIIGVGTSGVFDGIGIKIFKAGNVIVQNVTVKEVLVGDKDAISIEGPTDHIWVDHCELYAKYDGVGKDDYDGLLDVKKESEYITYSYNYLHDSWKMMLSGFSDSDDFNRTVTIHNNYFDNVNSRMPLFRFGKGHVFNNYYSGVASSAINSRMGACIKAENNYFKDVHNAIVTAYSDSPGNVQQIGNQFDNVTWDFSRDDVNEPGSCTLSLGYSYSTIPASSVPSVVVANAGVGKITNSSARISTTPGTNEQLLIDQTVEQLTLYPNPTTDRFTVNIPDFIGNETIRVVNLMGKEMMKFQANSNQQVIEAGSLLPGTYVLQVQTSGHSYIKMFVKK
ncbi:MAG: T9SS type A sorting domain-containing protein [Reichenbachiella sp.]